MWQPGQPADVFGDDGMSIFPSTVISGGTVTDSGGNVYDFTDGFYRFPFARPGQYRLLIEPPAPYTAPSQATPEQLAGFRRTDGEPFTIADGSYGGIIILDDPAPVRIDIPLDRPGVPIQITKDRIGDGRGTWGYAAIPNHRPEHRSGAKYGHSDH